MSAAPRKALAQFWQMMEALRARYAGGGGLGPLLEELLGRTGYQARLKEEFGPMAEPRIENIQELFSAIEEFEEREDEPGEGETARDLSAFLDQVALVSDVDELHDAHDTVLLMTLHSAKGLEFPVVFLAGMEEGLFPHFRSQTDPAELEEERRICYVGMTRAKTHLYLLHTETRRLYGSVQWNAPSRFLEEIPAELCEAVEHGALGGGAWSGASVWSDRAEGRPRHRTLEPVTAEMVNQAAEAPSDDVESLSIGAKVRHPFWGMGTVKLSEGRGERQKVVVHFPTVGMKKLLVHQARLERA